MLTAYPIRRWLRPDFRHNALVPVSGGKIREPGKMKPLRQADLLPRCDKGLAFETAIESDCAPLAAPVLELTEAGVDVHCLRDLTCGRLASALVEIAETAGLAVSLDEQSSRCARR
jgi:hypothetical protein